MGEALKREVVIIGAGPAGLTAAIYACRALLPTRVLEKAVPGGLLTRALAVENFPGFEEPIAGLDLMARIRRQAERLGAQIILEEAQRIARFDGGFLIETPSGPVEASAVVVAAGSRPRELNAVGIKRYVGRGVSYCATCDGVFFRGRDVLTVGAGDAGLSEALSLAEIAQSVGIVVRHPEGSPHALRASASLERRARAHPRIYFLWNRTVEEIRGDDVVRAVVLRHLESGALEERVADALFVHIGHIPETGFLRGTLPLDDEGYVLTDDHQRTPVEGVFAAGDVRSGASRHAQAVVAASEGAVAALEAERYLKGR